MGFAVSKSIQPYFHRIQRIISLLINSVIHCTGGELEAGVLFGKLALKEVSSMVDEFDMQLPEKRQ